MATISEDYVSFETAKLLKEKGFPQEYDEYHSVVYNEEDYEDEYEVQRMILETRIVKAGTLSSYPVGVPEPKCYCCTLQMAMKWLVREYKLYVNVVPSVEGYYWTDKWHSYVENLNKRYPFGRFISTFNSYEEACEAAIKYCLKHLI